MIFSAPSAIRLGYIQMLFIPLALTQKWRGLLTHPHAQFNRNFISNTDLIKQLLAELLLPHSRSPPKRLVYLRQQCSALPWASGTAAAPAQARLVGWGECGSAPPGSREAAPVQCGGGRCGRLRWLAHGCPSSAARPTPGKAKRTSRMAMASRPPRLAVRAESKIGLPRPRHTSKILRKQNAVGLTFNHDC